MPYALGSVEFVHAQGWPIQEAVTSGSQLMEAPQAADWWDASLSIYVPSVFLLLLPDSGVGKENGDKEEEEMWSYE